MLKRVLRSVILGAGGVGAIVLTIYAASSASAFEARTNDAAGVRVVVTPKALTPGGRSWDFEIVMDTHTKPLAEDLVGATVLVIGPDRRITPTAWQGDAPGGHHRKGVLKFPALAEDLKAFELRIDAIGGAARTFRWEVK